MTLSLQINNNHFHFVLVSLLFHLRCMRMCVRKKDGLSYIRPSSYEEGVCIERQLNALARTRCFIMISLPKPRSRRYMERVTNIVLLRHHC